MSGVWRPGSRLALFAALAFAAYIAIDLAVFPLAVRFPDEERFISEAIAFAQSGEFRVWENRAWEMPLAGVVYGVLYAAVDSTSALIAAARCLQALLLVAMAWFAADLARRLFGRRAAPLAFAGVLVYPMFVAFQALLLSELFFMTLLTSAIWCLYAWAEEPARLSRLVSYALLMAAATYAKASLTWLPLLLPVLLVLRPPYPWRAAARVFAVAAVVYCAALTPWWLRNAQLFGEPVWFTTTSASNLYLGNNRGNTTAGVDWNNDVEQPFTDETEKLPELERDRRYHARAVEYIKAEPGRFVYDMGRKLVRFWNVFPNYELFRKGPYRAVVAGSYGPALLLAVCAVWLYRREWRRLLPIYALFAYLTLVHTVTIASLRYRLPLEVFLVIFAAGALAHIAARRSLRVSGP
jgi:4-amino-4-deoxy-L-arabinose transferase-like glycosyltransferase